MRNFLLGVLVAALLLGAGGLGVLRLGLLPVGADAAPGPWEARLSGIAVAAGVARHAGGLRPPRTPTEEDLLAGMRIYKEMCEGCHGGPSGEKNLFGEAFYPPIPQLPSHPTPYSQAEVYWIAKHGIRRTGMPAWDRMVRDDDLWIVAAFIKKMDSLPPAVERAWKKKGGEAGR